jgi:hypothetical protein
VRRAALRAVAITIVAASAVVPLTGPAHGATPARRLPPADRDTLARIFDPMLEELGLRTTRARLQSLRDYEETPRGRHLAIYVEPIDDSFTNADYVSAYTELAQVFLPLVFNRWKGLKSFDVCQEPLNSLDPREEPPPLTQILVSRKGVRFVKWRHVTLTELLSVSDANAESEAEDGDPRDFHVYFHAQLDSEPELMTARANAASKPTTS